MSVTESTNIGTKVSVNTNTTQVRITPADQSKLVISDTTQNKVVISDPSRHDSIESVAPSINTVRVQDTLRQSVVSDITTNTVVINTGLQGPKGDTGDTGPEASDTNLANSQLVLSENRSFILNSSALSFREDALTTHNQSLQINSDGITIGATANSTAFLRLRNANDGNSLPYALSFRTPSTLGTNVTWTLPSTILTDGLLTTNDSGEWSFTDTLNINELTASGNISSSFDSTASFGIYLGDGSQLTGVQSTIETSSFAITGSDVTFNNVTASGDISSSGTIIANTYTNLPHSETYALGFVNTSGIDARKSYFTSLERTSAALVNSNFGAATFNMPANEYVNRAIVLKDKGTCTDIYVQGFVIVDGQPSYSTNIQLDIYHSTASLAMAATQSLTRATGFEIPTDPTLTYQVLNFSGSISNAVDSIGENSMITLAVSNTSPSIDFTGGTVTISAFLTHRYTK